MRHGLDNEHYNAMGRSKLRRFCIAAVPACVITGALFIAMQSAVEVDDFSPSELPVYELVEFKPIEIEQPRNIDDRSLRPQKPIRPPPKAPPLVKDINMVDMPADGYSGAVPASYGDGDLHALKPTRATSVIDRTIVPITPPVPVYPSAAARRGLEGDCSVHLSVSTRGEPFNVRADCSHHVFESAARKAVQKVKFAPQIRDGLPVTVTGVVYPLEFRMEP